MRRLVLAMILAGLAQVAQAADLPDLSDTPVLRGGFADGLSKNTVNWQGAYVGGQIGYSAANMDFSQADTSLTAYMLQNLSLADTVSGWTLLGKGSPASTSFGGFVGWNSQWDDVTLGIEANYNRFSNLTGSSVNNSLPYVAFSGPPNCFAPPAGDSSQCGVQLSGSASARMTDLLTLRGRAGWTIDNFMPYMFGGAAFGRADIVRTATVTDVTSFYNSASMPDGSATGIWSKTEVSNGVFTYGYTAGVGLEAMVWCGMFLRAEYEYVKFSTIKDININLNTVRLGVGYKF